jgi:TDG/mug DNA glycosylase family protein
MKLVIVGCNPTNRRYAPGITIPARQSVLADFTFRDGCDPRASGISRDDKRIIEFAIGLTDLVKRPTRTIEELTREDYAEGRIVLSQKLGNLCRT